LFGGHSPHVARNYDHIIDLESQGTVQADCDPVLKVSWGARRSLKEDDLNRCGMVLTYLFMIDSKGPEAVHHYLRALTAMARTDIFLQIQTNAVQMFSRLFNASCSTIQIGMAPGTLESR
jgi:hypothetical protein